MLINHLYVLPWDYTLNAHYKDWMGYLVASLYLDLLNAHAHSEFWFFVNKGNSQSRKKVFWYTADKFIYCELSIYRICSNKLCSVLDRYSDLCWCIFVVNWIALLGKIPWRTAHNVELRILHANNVQDSAYLGFCDQLWILLRCNH